MNRRNFLKNSMLASISTTVFGAYPHLAAPLSKDKKQKIVLIGSGVTALCLGALLAKEGHQICVLEAHQNLLGGHSRTVEFHGLKFSAGPEYSWNFGEGQVGNLVLKHLGLAEKIPFCKMNEAGFERVMIEGKPFFDVPIGLEKYEASLKEKFPLESAHIQYFFHLLQLIHQVIAYLHDTGMYLEEEHTAISRIFLTPKLSLAEKKMMKKIGRYTLKQVFEMCNLSQEVRNILFGYGGIFLENDDKMAFAIYAGGIGYYHLGAYYPKFGYESIVKGLANYVLEKGGEVHTNAKVERLEYANQQIVKVHTARNTWEPDAVISALSPRLTYALIEKIPVQKFDYQPSNTVTTFYIGIEKDAEIENILRGRSIWWKNAKSPIDFEDTNIHQTPAMCYISSTTAKGYGGEANLTALTAIIESNFEAVKEIYLKGESEIFAYKQEIKKKVMTLIEMQIFPNFQSKIRFCEVVTPYDCFLQIGAEKGNSYGRRLTPESIFTKINAPTKVENLTIACATMGLPGIAICFNTAQLLFTKMTGKRLAGL